MKAGDLLTLADGTQVEVTDVTYEDQHETVYNLEVADYHTYYVGKDGVWVHNRYGQQVGGNNIGYNGYEKKLNVGQQNKHIPGTNEYKVVTADGQSRSIMYGTNDDIQALLNEYSGKGIPVNANKERVEFGKVIGLYVDPMTKEAVETTVGIIHYGNNGAHIVPAFPD